MIETQHSVKDYLYTSYEPDTEFVNGALTGKNVGTIVHGPFQAIIAAYFYNLRMTYPKLKPMTAVRLKMGQQYRIPDVMVLEWPYTPGKVVTDVPAVVIELLSPDDGFCDLVAKFEEYRAF